MHLPLRRIPLWKPRIKPRQQTQPLRLTFFQQMAQKLWSRHSLFPNYFLNRLQTKRPLGRKAEGSFAKGAVFRYTYIRNRSFHVSRGLVTWEKSRKFLGPHFLVALSISPPFSLSSSSGGSTGKYQRMYIPSRFLWGRGSVHRSPFQTRSPSSRPSSSFFLRVLW